MGAPFQALLMSAGLSEEGVATYVFDTFDRDLNDYWLGHNWDEVWPTRLKFVNGSFLATAYVQPSSSAAGAPPEYLDSRSTIAVVAESIYTFSADQAVKIKINPGISAAARFGPILRWGVDGGYLAYFYWNNPWTVYIATVTQANIRDNTAPTVLGSAPIASQLPYPATMRFEAYGDTLAVYDRNDVLLLQVSDSTHSAGQPGFACNTGSGSVAANFEAYDIHELNAAPPVAPQIALAPTYNPAFVLDEVYDKLRPYVILDLPFDQGPDGALGSGFVKDHMNYYSTFGNAQLSNQITKFGVTALKLDGTGDYVQTTNTYTYHHMLPYNSFYTVEAWIYLEEQRANQIITFQNTSLTGWSFVVNSSNKLEVRSSPAGGGTSYTITGNDVLVPLNTWVHVAAQRQSNRCRLYVNGQLAGSGTLANTTIQTGFAFRIGGHPNGAFFKGRIANLRITTWAVRYRDSFTPPTMAYPQISNYPWTQTDVLTVPEAVDARYGNAVALSADGLTLVVGASEYDFDALFDEGAVYVYTRIAGVWTQQQFIRGDQTGFKRFGHHLTLSADGNTLAITSPTPYYTGPSGDTGAVYIFTRTAGVWTKQAVLVSPAPNTGSQFGYSTALTPDGNLLVVGAYNSNAGAVLAAGKVFVYTRTGSVWSAPTTIDAISPATSAKFGYAVEVFPSSVHPTEIYVTQLNNTSPAKIYVFASTPEGDWVNMGPLSPRFTYGGGSQNYFGETIRISGDGTTLVVGYPGAYYGLYQSNGFWGSVVVFEKQDGLWTLPPRCELFPPHPKLPLSTIGFGGRLAVSHDGNTIAIGEGDQQVSDKSNAGVVYLARRTAGVWSIDEMVVGPEQLNGQFGTCLDMDSQATVLAIGASTIVLPNIYIYEDI